MSTLESSTTATDVHKKPPTPPPGSDHVDQKTDKTEGTSTTADNHGLGRQTLGDIKALNPAHPAVTEKSATEVGHLVIPSIDEATGKPPVAKPGEPVKAGDPVPKAGDPVPKAGDPVPKAGDPVPKAGDPVPKAGDPVPKAGDPVLKAGDPVPKAGDPVPKAGDPVTPVPPKADAAKTDTAGGGFMSMVSGIGKEIGNLSYEAASAVVGKDNVDSFLNSDAVKGVENMTASGYNYATDLLTNANMTDTKVGDNGVATTTVSAGAQSWMTTATAQTEFMSGTNGDKNMKMIDSMLNTVATDAKGQKGQAVGVDTTYKTLDAERNAVVAGRKPGDPKQWEDPSSHKVYTLDDKNNLMIADGQNITWVGQDGKSFQSKDGVQTWTKDGTKLVSDSKGDYDFTDAKGNQTKLDKAEGKIVHTVQGLEIDQFQSIRQKLTFDEMAKLPANVAVMHGNAMMYAETDAKGNKLVKDSLASGETVMQAGENGQPGKWYHIEGNKVFAIGPDGQPSKEPLADDKLPPSLKRTADGLQFDGVHIDGKDHIHDDKHDVNLSNLSNKFDAEQGTIQASVANNTQTLDVKNVLHSQSVFNPETHTSTYSQTGPDGRPQFNYNFNDGTMHGDGITMTPMGSHIAGTNFAVSQMGNLESANQFTSDNVNAGIMDAGDYSPTAINNPDTGDFSDSSASAQAQQDQQDQQDQQQQQQEQQQEQQQQQLAEQQQQQQQQQELAQAQAYADQQDPDNPNTWKGYDHDRAKEEKREIAEAGKEETVADRETGTSTKIGDRWNDLKKRDEVKEDDKAQHGANWLADNKDILHNPYAPTELKRKELMDKAPAEISTVQEVGAKLRSGDQIAAGDVGKIEDVKAVVAFASSVSGIDLGAVESRLTAMERGIDAKLAAAETLKEAGGDPSAANIKSLMEKGVGPRSATNVVRQQQDISDVA